MDDQRRAKQQQRRHVRHHLSRVDDEDRREGQQQGGNRGRLHRARKIARQDPAGDDRQRTLRHHRIFENQISVARRNLEERMGQQVQRMIVEDEETAPQRHRRRVTTQRKYRVIEAVPIADKRIDEDENEN